MSGHRFCTDLCLERGEPLEGTGDAPERVLMLAWPRGKWRTPRWESVDMSPALSEALHFAAMNRLHVALIDRVGETGSLPTLHALPESVHRDFADEHDLIAAIRAYVAGELFEGEHDPRTTIICCTDSKRDACCARYGFSTYKALVAVANPDAFHIVQATHIGGCRFAASLVVMPHRQRYGRMTAGQAGAFLEALSRDEIFLPAFKGRTDTAEPNQIAELAAMRWAKDRGGDGHVRLLDPAPDGEAHDGDSIVMRAQVGAATLRIDLRAREFQVQGNCGIVAGGGGLDVVRWCLESLSEMPT